MSHPLLWPADCSRVQVILHFFIFIYHSLFLSRSYVGVFGIHRTGVSRLGEYFIVSLIRSAQRKINFFKTGQFLIVSKCRTGYYVILVSHTVFYITWHSSLLPITNQSVSQSIAAPPIMPSSVIIGRWSPPIRWRRAKPVNSSLLIGKKSIPKIDQHSNNFQYQEDRLSGVRALVPARTRKWLEVAKKGFPFQGFFWLQVGDM